MNVRYTPEAEAELIALPPRKQLALVAAVDKLEIYRDRLASPHSSAIRGVGGTLRELRPRGGRSRWRAFYRRVSDVMVIGSIGPEAQVDPRGFRRAVAAALEQLAAIGPEEANDGDRDERRGT